MLVSEDNILQLIPQRYPMVMIHSLLFCDDKQVVSRFDIREDNIFLDDKRMTASGLMENMAQTAAVRTGWRMRNQYGGENKKVPVGVIGSIKNFKLYFQPKVGSVIETTVMVEHEVFQATMVKGRVECGSVLVAESEMQIFLTENQ